jgi:cell division protein FtsQ
MNDISIRVADRPTPPADLRRRLQPFWRRRAKRAAIAVVVLAAVIGYPAWLLRSGGAARLAEAARQQVIALSARAGFRVDEIYVEGRSRTPRNELLAALRIRRGDPIFALDLAATRQKIEEISWVKTVTIERRLPSELHLLITERAPIVVWQNQGRYYLVDRDGQVVGDEVDEYAGLPLMVGESAPDHAAELIDLLGAEPDLKKRVKASQWVGDRRWNITVERAQGSAEIQLPEENPLGAWHELAKLDREQSLLERAVTVIDMRLPDRLVLRTTGGGEPPAPANRAKRKPRPGKDA